jgi:hypothetical protein
MVHAYTFVVRVYYCPSFVFWFFVTWLHLNMSLSMFLNTLNIYTQSNVVELCIYTFHLLL